MKIKIIDLGQWIGMLALIVGIALMVWDNRAPGETVIAIASLIYAIATKVKYYRKRGKKNDVSDAISDKKPKSRGAERSRDKRSELADDDSVRGYVPSVLETGSPTGNDRGKPK